MKYLLLIIAILGLALTILPAVLVFKGIIEWKTHAQLMVLGMLLWFSVAPFVMKKKNSES